MIDLSSVGERTRAEIFAPVAAPTNPSPAAPVEDLSPNAQALAAFFEAEIGSKEVQKPAASAPKASETQPQPKKEQSDAFESSLGSIDWNEGPAASSLQQWSANQPAGKPASTDNPPPFQKTMEKPQARTAPAGAATSISPGESTSFLFDTGKSNFRFSEDYIHRITKSFSGATEENVPEKHSVFPQQSDDRRQNQEIITPPEKNSAVPAGKLTSPRAGGGAWSEQDVAMIEKIVREEVQMVVREVAEKIAWEVIPELAENLIRKELEKVMKDLGQ